MLKEEHILRLSGLILTGAGTLICAIAAAKQSEKDAERLVKECISQLQNRAN